jgi:stage V sporulation protein SpoVS
MENKNNNTIELDTVQLDGVSFKRTKPDSPILMVASKTPPKNLAKAIVGCVKEHGYCELLCVLHGPTWQGMKALICATAELKSIGVEVYFAASFMEPRPIVDGKVKTGIRISIYPYSDSGPTEAISSSLEDQGIIQV